MKRMFSIIVKINGLWELTGFFGILWNSTYTFQDKKSNKNEIRFLFCFVLWFSFSFTYIEVTFFPAARQRALQISPVIIPFEQEEARSRRAAANK